MVEGIDEAVLSAVRKGDTDGLERLQRFCDWILWTWLRGRGYAVPRATAVNDPEIRELVVNTVTDTHFYILSTPSAVPAGVEREARRLASQHASRYMRHRIRRAELDEDHVPYVSPLSLPELEERIIDRARKIAQGKNLRTQIMVDTLWALGQLHERLSDSTQPLIETLFAQLSRRVRRRSSRNLDTVLASLNRMEKRLGLL